ncbi:cysteine desulfurase family protein [Vreelandella alkaliphila]|uniref:cysteine desulfurase family protein n=1 Tax=Vreelandella alkaliphila TaxID=272774 RepID=UPI003FD6FFFF
MRIGDSIYMDYQASTPLDPRVAIAMTPYATEIFANPHASQYSLGQQAYNACNSAQSVIAEAIGAMANEIVFTSGATEANNQAVAGVLFGYKGKRNKVLISAIEHKCVKEAAAFYGKHLGYHVEEIPVLSTGEIDPIAYSLMLTEEVLLVSVMAVNNEIGTVQQVAILAEQAHNIGALFHCDAAQAADAVDIDVMDWGVDLLSLSAHKMYGPKGIGALFIDASLHQDFPALIQGGGQQEGLRSGTLPTPLCVGFGKAVSLWGAEKEHRRAHLRHMSDIFLQTLDDKNISYQINGAKSFRHFGNLNIELIDIDAESLLMRLQPYVCASTGSACNSGFLASSYVLSAIGLSTSKASSSIRFSFGQGTDVSQIEEVVHRINKIVKS